MHKEPGRFNHWISGSIRRKLSMFVIMVCLLLISLVWLLVVRLLNPVYNAWIRRELEFACESVVHILDKAEAEGIAIEEVYTSDGQVALGLSSECRGRIWDAVNSGKLKISDRSLDIAGTSNSLLYGLDNLSDNILHPTVRISQDNQMIVQITEKNSPNTLLWRDAVLKQGYFYSTSADARQMVVGLSTQNGKYSVLLAANIERIPQAVNVLQRLMLPVSLALIVISVLGAWVFSRWFTKPIQRLSLATQEMAKGNYNVSVRVGGHDEITDLADNFNTMAQEVKRSADLQRDLFANVSHDLRTPLTLIKGYAETVRDLTGDNPEKRSEQLSVIVDETDRLSALVGSVLEFTRISSGGETLDAVHFDLYEFCDEIAFRYNDACQREGCRFEFVGEEPCEICADPALIERAMHNLLSNALKHVGEDKLVILRLFKTGTGTACVEVIDHGPGIPEEDVPHLFDRYYRSRADAGKPGTGLGLAITKAIFAMHSFPFGIKTKLGEGTTFWFEVPLCSAVKK